MEGRSGEQEEEDRYGKRMRLWSQQKWEANRKNRASRGRVTNVLDQQLIAVQLLGVSLGEARSGHLKLSFGDLERKEKFDLLYRSP